MENGAPFSFCISPFLLSLPLRAVVRSLFCSLFVFASFVLKERKKTNWMQGDRSNWGAATFVKMASVCCWKEILSLGVSFPFFAFPLFSAVQRQRLSKFKHNRSNRKTVRFIRNKEMEKPLFQFEMQKYSEVNRKN